MTNYLFVSGKPWHDETFLQLKKNEKENWFRIKEKREFNLSFLNKISPDKIFIPHWSYKISKEIWSNFECILFHMTDLPYGRGGSPLQNLIIRDKTKTKISAIRVNQGIDQGDIYIKKSVSLEGSAKDIFERSSPIILKMINEINNTKISLKKQVGEVTYFNRREKEESDIKDIEELVKIYDHIRMLDCEGYPNAYLETKKFKFFFKNASFENNEIQANVRIVKK